MLILTYCLVIAHIGQAALPTLTLAELQTLEDLPGDKSPRTILRRGSPESPSSSNPATTPTALFSPTSLVARLCQTSRRLPACEEISPSPQLASTPTSVMSRISPTATSAELPMPSMFTMTVAIPKASTLAKSIRDFDRQVHLLSGVEPVADRLLRYGEFLSGVSNGLRMPLWVAGALDNRVDRRTVTAKNARDYFSAPPEYKGDVPQPED